MKKVVSITLIALAMASLQVKGQAEQPSDTTSATGKVRRDAGSAIQKINGILDLRDSRSRAHVDTNYLQRSPERLRLKLRVNASGSNLIIRGATNANSYKMTLEAQNKYTVSLSGSYRGLSLGVAVNPTHWAGKNKDYEFNMNAYGNRFGADVIFQSTNTFKGTITTSDTRINVPVGVVRQNMLYLNTYYVFNSRRFSYPAAFSQSWIQLRSCGSWMAGASFMGGNLRTKHYDTIGNEYSRWSIAIVGMGAGYGYNWVVKRHWVIHLSTLPQLVVFSKCSMKADDLRKKSPYKFPNIIAVGRMAVVRHYDRWLLGMTTVVNTSSIGDRDQLQLHTIKWRARLFVGIKL